MSTITDKYSVGVRLGEYTATPSNSIEKSILEFADLMKFKAVSVGNSFGQIAIFPTDFLGEDKAWQHAQDFADFMNSKIS